MDDLKLRRAAARAEALDAAQRRHATQGELDAELQDLDRRYERARKDYLLSRGFRFMPDGRKQELEKSTEPKEKP